MKQEEEEQEKKHKSTNCFIVNDDKYIKFFLKTLQSFPKPRSPSLIPTNAENNFQLLLNQKGFDTSNDEAWNMTWTLILEQPSFQYWILEPFIGVLQHQITVKDIQVKEKIHPDQYLSLFLGFAWLLSHASDGTSAWTDSKELYGKYIIHPRPWKFCCKSQSISDLIFVEVDNGLSLFEQLFDFLWNNNQSALFYLFDSMPIFQTCTLWEFCYRIFTCKYFGPYVPLQLPIDSFTHQTIRLKFDILEKSPDDVSFRVLDEIKALLAMAPRQYVSVHLRLFNHFFTTHNLPSEARPFSSKEEWKVWMKYVGDEFEVLLFPQKLKTIASSSSSSLKPIICSSTQQLVEYIESKNNLFSFPFEIAIAQPYCSTKKSTRFPSKPDPLMSYLIRFRVSSSETQYSYLQVHEDFIHFHQYSPRIYVCESSCPKIAITLCESLHCESNEQPIIITNKPEIKSRFQTIQPNEDTTSISSILSINVCIIHYNCLPKLKSFNLHPRIIIVLVKPQTTIKWDLIRKLCTNSTRLHSMNIEWSLTNFRYFSFEPDRKRLKI